jgi:hypothetical protein
MVSAGQSKPAIVFLRQRGSGIALAATGGLELADHEPLSNRLQVSSEPPIRWPWLVRRQLVSKRNSANPSRVGRKVSGSAQIRAVGKSEAAVQLTAKSPATAA